MQNRIKVLAAIKAANKEHWSDACYWLIFTFFGSLLAVYGGYFLLRLVSQEIAIMDLCRKGEFALYSAAILVTIFHLIWKDAYRGPIVNLRLFGSTALFLFFFAALIFAGVTTADAISEGENSVLNQKLLIPASIGIFIVTLIVGFIVNLIDSVRLTPDLERFEKADEEELRKAFRKTRGENDER